jgi:hypothetical protein
MSETFKSKDGKHVNCFMKRAVRIDNIYIPYKKIKSFICSNGCVYITYNESRPLCLTFSSSDGCEKVMGTLQKYIDNYWSDDGRLERIEKKLDDLFYAPEMTGYQEAKSDFEQKTKN